MTTTKIAAALLAAQKEFQDPVKDSVNLHFKSRYAGLQAILSAVRPALHKHGIVIMQALAVRDGHDILDTDLVCAEDGSRVTSSMRLHLEKNTPQGMGSAITYARRYALSALCGIVADEDDDAEEVSKPVRKPPIAVVHVAPKHEVSEEEKWVAEEAVLRIAKAKDIAALERIGHLIRGCGFIGEDHKMVREAYVAKEKEMRSR